MQVDIRKLGGLSVYFPYLDQKSGTLTPLRNELGWIILLTLFTDRVLFPPRSVFSGPYALQNIADLSRIHILRDLVSDGVLVTTATDQRIRDMSDLIEHYSGLSIDGELTYLSEFPIYSRDEKYQKDVASNFLTENIDVSQIITSDERTRLLRVVNLRQKHALLIKNISAVLVDNNSAITEIQRYANVGYFLGGAKGNSCIMPPVFDSQPHEHFDYFYSKKVLVNFGRQLERQLGHPLQNISICKLRSLRGNLRVFREQYNNAACKHRALFGEVALALSRTHPSARLRIPILALQAAAATTIGIALAPVFGYVAFGFAVAAKFSWETVSKGYKINDRVSEKLRLVLTQIGAMKPYHKDLLELLENFDKSVKTALLR